MEKKQQPQTPKGTCVVFSCLEKINDLSIDQKEKERLTRKNEGNEKSLSMPWLLYFNPHLHLNDRF